ncbi:MAG: hypothetical protein JW889_03595 [Verrucomicrobia bacterium]|nr:hypothetical protein [Verrucomicrobiota bacterium]
MIIESVRSGATDHFLYIPNFCIAEVFGVFAKYAFCRWSMKGTIDGRVYESLRSQFQKDIHNAALLYHYELARYHVLAIGMVAPIDYYFQVTRRRKTKSKPKPAGAFDQLIVAMGIHLTKIHGPGNVVIITADHRLSKVVERCRKLVSASAWKKLHLDEVERFVGIPFTPESFPLVLHLPTATRTTYTEVFGTWPLPQNKKYKKPYHLRNQNRRT